MNMSTDKCKSQSITALLSNGLHFTIVVSYLLYHIPQGRQMKFYLKEQQHISKNMYIEKNTILKKRNNQYKYITTTKTSLFGLLVFPMSTSIAVPLVGKPLPNLVLCDASKLG